MEPCPGNNRKRSSESIRAYHDNQASRTDNLKGCGLKPGMQVGGAYSARFLHPCFRRMRSVSTLPFVSRLIAIRLATVFFHADSRGTDGSLGSKTKSDSPGVHDTHPSEIPTFIEAHTQISRSVNGPRQASAGLPGVSRISAFSNVPYRKLPGGRAMRSFGCNGCE